MLKCYTEMMWLMAGTCVLTYPFWKPITYVAGAFIVVLSLIKIFGA